MCACLCLCVCVTMDRSYMEAITGSEGPQTPTVPLSLGQTEFISLPLSPFSFCLSISIFFSLCLFNSLSFSVPLSLFLSLWTKLLSYEPQTKGQGETPFYFFIGNKNPGHILIHITHFQFVQTSPENTSTN